MGGLPSPLTSSKVEKMSFSTLERRNLALFKVWVSLLCDFPSYLTRISSEKYRFA